MRGPAPGAYTPEGGREMSHKVEVAVLLGVAPGDFTEETFYIKTLYSPSKRRMEPGRCDGGCDGGRAPVTVSIVIFSGCCKKPLHELNYNDLFLHSIFYSNPIQSCI